MPVERVVVGGDRRPAAGGRAARTPATVSRAAGAAPTRRATRLGRLPADRRLAAVDAQVRRAGAQVDPVRRGRPAQRRPRRRRARGASKWSVAGSVRPGVCGQVAARRPRRPGRRRRCCGQPPAGHSTRLDRGLPAEHAVARAGCRAGPTRCARYHWPFWVWTRLPCPAFCSRRSGRPTRGEQRPGRVRPRTARTASRDRATVTWCSQLVPPSAVTS